MEDSFNVRVGKIFGSLNPSSSYSSTPRSSLWCLTDNEVERKPWNREIQTPELETTSPPSDDDGDDDNEGLLPAKKPDDYNDEEWELKSSIGLDCTLDHEEEEDEYDKVADAPEDRLYMRDVEDYGVEEEVLVAFSDGVRDPRANHSAAKIRLREDDEGGALNLKPKPILKRKDTRLNSKSTKRVHFDPDCIDHTSTAAANNDDDHRERNPASGVPDYMRNPTRYTRYTFDSVSEVDEDSNKQAYVDFLRTLDKSNSGTATEEDQDRDLLKPVMFVARKKAGDTRAMVDSCTELVQQVGIGKDAAAVGRSVPTAIPVEDSTACAMEEDEPPLEASSASQRGGSHKPGRQYRVKSRSELD